MQQETMGGAFLIIQLFNFKFSNHPVDFFLLF